MRWRGQRQSENIEDRRDERGGFGFPFPGGGMRFPSGGGSGRGRGGGIGIVGLLIILGLMLFLGVDPSVIMQGGRPGGDVTTFPDIRLPQSRPDATNFPIPGGESGPQIQRPRTTSADDLKQFVAVVLGSTEDVWQDLLAGYGKRYSDPTLVLFTGATRSACGTGLAAMGPFYCPLDQKVYIDLDFYKELKSRFRAPGDFAQAYVIAHEIGHHVQTLLGITEQVEALKGRVGERQANAIQVRMELQADCFAGVWANRADETKNIVEPGDIDEALNAASAIGDDRIQRQTQGYVVPDAFTHGSSAQRTRWFKRGYESGKLEACDTFNAEQL
jgi:predicted metalloprotease